ncbi:flagellar hook-associated protein FlgK [Sphingomonas sp.]|uniref:flagellar hook-associated protein FlgK n=1 Tax=Sphingomonas sp. TaxID=28214 RepID=UPI003AFF73BA
MSDLLSIGASGVRAYQTALSTVGDNIANTGVAGYSRRTTNLAEVTSLTSVTGRLVDGVGVTVNGVSRTGEMFRAQAVRSAGTELARTEAGTVWLDRVQDALTGSSLGTRLTSFFGGARSLAADPTSVPQRAVVLEQAGAVAQAFGTTGRQLDAGMDELDDRARQATTQLDGLAQSLARVNDGLGRASPDSTNAAQLADQRDQLLDQMSALTDLSVSFDPIGRAVVALGPGGPTYVQGSNAGHVIYARSGGAVAYSMQGTDGVHSFSPAGGAMAGIAEGAGRLDDARTSLNALATDFATEVNAIQAAGRNLDGQPGAAIFAVGATPTDLTATLTDPRGIAAASVGGGVRDASNLAQLESSRTSHGWEAALTGLTAGNAAALEQRKLVGDAQSAIRNGAVAAQAAVSGVNLDQEAVDLLRFQQAYQACSRAIQVARETMQTLMDIR